MRIPLTMTLTSALAACGGGGGGSSFGSMTQPEITTVPAEVEGSAVDSSSTVGPGPESSTSTSEHSSTSAGISTGGGTVWDMGMPDFGAQQPAGCAGKIDFLFVISASGTMKGSQEKLLASYPGFMKAIEDQFPDFDLHILVANPNSEPGWLLEDCSLCMDDCDPMGLPPTCGATLTACDKKTGAGVTFPAGENASNRRCELAGGLRYIVSGQQDIKEAFACVAQVGISGGVVAGEAMVAALAPKFNDPESDYACNGGFLREDALLVVTLIQDTFEQDSLGTVEEWIAALRAAKGQDDDAFAVMVLTTDIDVDYGQLCDPNDFTMVKNRLRLLAEGVEHGWVGSICLPSFVDFFAEHVGYLVDLCDDFVAPG